MTKKQRATIDILQGAHDLIARPYGWITGTSQRMVGDKVGYCMLGALHESYTHLDADLKKASVAMPAETWARVLLQDEARKSFKVNGYLSIPYINDTHAKGDKRYILRIFKRAIKRAEAGR